jgi:hypothetical protein
LNGKRYTAGSREKRYISLTEYRIVILWEKVKVPWTGFLGPQGRRELLSPPPRRWMERFPNASSSKIICISISPDETLLIEDV